MGNLELNIRNFQSITEASLEFIPGINLIVGPSNSGKTAIFRAVNALLNNPTVSKTFVKHTQPEAEVELSYNGNLYTWLKQAKGGTVYGVNGEEYSKVGTSGLFDLHPDNGFVQYDGDVMNIEGEWDLPFPFDRSPAELFKIFENVFCVSDSASILRSYKEEETDLVKRTNDLQLDVERLTKKITALDELAEEVNIEGIKKDLENLEKLQSEYFGIHDDYGTIIKGSVLDNFSLEDKLPPTTNSILDYQECVNDIKFLSNVANRTKFYKSLPEILEVPNSVDTYLSMVDDVKEVEKASVRTNFYESLPEVMEVPNTIAEYIVLSKDLEEIGEASRVDKFNIDKELEITGETLEYYFNLRDDLGDIIKGADADKITFEKECVEDTSLTLPDYLALYDDIQEVTNIYRRCKELKTQCENLDARILQLKEEQNKYKICPLCGQKLVGEHAEC